MQTNTGTVIAMSDHDDEGPKFLSFADGFKELGVRISGSTLEWEDVAYTVMVPPKKGLPCKKVPKEILRGISGIATPGKSLAIMGPSGAGKSSMLNMLAGRISKKCGVAMSHRIKFNGVVSTPAHYGGRIAYVMQDDALFPTATVRETVMFAAFLRPGPFQACEFAKKRELVDMLLKALGLWGSRDTLIGNPPMITGVSGGEKRRVSIACELVTIPEILFLDEPTSGLDSFAAYQVVTALQSLTAAGCTVLCTIHQPSSEVFRLFDNTVLLVNGATVYHGPVDRMTDYFASDAGGNISCPPGTNPADHFMFHVQKEPSAALQLMEHRWDAQAARGAKVEVESTAKADVDTTPFPETAANEKQSPADEDAAAEGGVSVSRLPLPRGITFHANPSHNFDLAILFLTRQVEGGVELVRASVASAAAVVPIPDAELMPAAPTERGLGADFCTQVRVKDWRVFNFDYCFCVRPVLITLSSPSLCQPTTCLRSSDFSLHGK